VLGSPAGRAAFVRGYEEYEDLPDEATVRVYSSARNVDMTIDAEFTPTIS
jgi:hypothetical protein